MTHAFIIRMHYPQGDPRFAWRLSYFYSMVLPRLLSQTDQNFDIWIRCRVEDAALIQSLHPRLHTFFVENEAENHVGKWGKQYFMDFVPWASVRGLPQYDIQSGLDSDDLIARDYVERVNIEVGQYALAFPNRSLHISFQPGIFDLKKLQTGPIGVGYSPRRGSAFFSLYQPNKAKYIFAYEDSHLRLWKYVDKSVTLEAGHCWATAHDLNESTTSKL